MDKVLVASRPQTHLCLCSREFAPAAMDLRQHTEDELC